MFGILFALVVVTIILAAVSHRAFKFYLVIKEQERNNALITDVNTQLSDDYESLLADRNQLAASLNAARQRETDMEAALNLTLLETIKDEVKIVPISEFDGRHHHKTLVPSIGTGAHDLLTAHLSERAPEPERVRVDKIWMEDPNTGAITDITRMDKDWKIPGVPTSDN